MEYFFVSLLAVCMVLILMVWFLPSGLQWEINDWIEGLTLDFNPAKVTAMYFVWVAIIMAVLGILYNHVGFSGGWEVLVSMCALAGTTLLLWFCYLLFVLDVKGA